MCGKLRQKAHKFKASLGRSEKLFQKLEARKNKNRGPAVVIHAFNFSRRETDRQTDRWGEGTASWLKAKAS